MDDVLAHSKRMLGSLVRLVRRADIGQLIAMYVSTNPYPISSKGHQMLEIHKSHRGFAIDEEHASPHVCRGGGDSSSFKPGGWPKDLRVLVRNVRESFGASTIMMRKVGGGLTNEPTIISEYLNPLEIRRS